VKKKRKPKPKAKKAAQQTAQESQAPSPEPPESSHPRSGRLRKIEFGALASLIGLVLASPTVFEEWKKITPETELGGDIDDQSHPYNIPLVIKDLSAIFNFYSAEVFARASMTMTLPGGGRIPIQMTDGEIHKITVITPSSPFFFVSTPASTISLKRNDTGELMPVDSGQLFIKIKYEISLLRIYNLEREADAVFSLIRSPKGLRWVRGDKVPNVTPKH
jgi:hypothetical protein